MQLSNRSRRADIASHPTTLPRNFNFEDVHREGARRIAEIAEACGVSRLIHVSHLNADLDSPSAFLRTKAEGEEAVRGAFEGATIVRPGPLFGHEDRLLNSIASECSRRTAMLPECTKSPAVCSRSLAAPPAWPITWHVNHGRTKLRPTHSINVAQALEIMMDADNTSMGQTFSLASPRYYTIEELRNLVQSLTMKKLVREGVNVPKFAMRLATRAGDQAWWPMLSPDELERRYVDDLPDAPGTKSWADLGMEPDKIEDVAITYLRMYRSHLHYELPVEGSGMRLKKEPYRVID